MLIQLARTTGLVERVMTHLRVRYQHLYYSLDVFIQKCDI